MKVKCENIVTCGNYKCAYNHFSECIKNVVALNEEGKCVLFKTKPEPTPKEPGIKTS